MLNNIYWLLPEIYLGIVTCLILAFGVFITKWNKKLNNLISLSLIFGLLLNAELLYDNVHISNNLLISNSSIVLVKIVLLLTSSIIMLLPNKIYKYEFGLLVLLSTLGMMLLVSSNDLIMLYLSIELISLSLYVLASLNKDSQHSTESGLKYFLLGALSSGLLLFGMGLVYGYTGETNFDGLNSYIWYGPEINQIIVGVLFIFVAILFKLGAAPFHMWLPDVYEGAPTIVTAYFAIVPKIAIILTFINLIITPFIGIWNSIEPIIIISAILSLIVGSIGAINQGKIKRLISYSAISHIGFILIGIIPLSLYSIQATIIYILIYIIMSLNTFTILLNLNQYNYISQFSGLSRANPILALTFGFTLLSIAGIPPLAGFFSKYLVLLNAVENGYYVLSIIAVMGSAISTFYYLRIIKWMFFKDSTYYHYKDLGDVIYPINIRINFISSIILGVTIFLIITILFFPQIITSSTFLSITWWLLI